MINPTDYEYEAQQRASQPRNLPDLPDEFRAPVQFQPCPICGEHPTTWIINGEYITDCQEHGLSVWAEQNTQMELEMSRTRQEAANAWNEIVWRFAWANKPQLAREVAL